MIRTTPLLAALCAAPVSAQDAAQLMTSQFFLNSACIDNRPTFSEDVFLESAVAYGFRPTSNGMYATQDGSILSVLVTDSEPQTCLMLLPGTEFEPMVAFYSGALQASNAGFDADSWVRTEDQAFVYLTDDKGDFTFSITRIEDGILVGILLGHVE